MARRSAELVIPNGKATYQRRSDRFLHGLREADSVTFVSHVHPDPDSLGSMMGLAHLVETCLDKPTRLTRDGLIGRAENRAMVDLLKIPLNSIESISWHGGEAVVMVDSQPNTGRHNLPLRTPLYAVIDHHDTPGDVEGVPFVDVRRSLGATCSLVTSYLMEQSISMPARLATALLYGIETELSGYPREASSLDDRRCCTFIPWPTRICWRASATPACRKATLKACSGRCKARLSTIGLSSAGSTRCRNLSWRRKSSTF